MTYGFSTRSIGAPIGTAGAFAPTLPSVKLVPLSVFFLNMQDGKGDEEGDQMYGLKMPSENTPEQDKEKEKPEDEKEARKGKRKGKKKPSVQRKEPPKKPKQPEQGGPEPKMGASESIMEGKINKPQKCKYCDGAATKAYLWANGRAYIPVCDAHESNAKTRIEKTNRDKVSAIRSIPQKRQTTAVEQGPTKMGATRASSGAMGSGNVAQYPVPLGPPLRRLTPIGGEEEEKKKRRRKRLKGEDRDRWIERLMEIAR